jgi:cytidyltransferase-like protein
MYEKITSDNSSVMPKVFVSGCFDVLHSGHIAFLEEAASYGDVYVSLGSDETVWQLKNRKTMYTEQERKYMLEAIRFVKKVYIGPDTGKILDFAPLLDEVKPDIFFVNAKDCSWKTELNVPLSISEEAPYLESVTIHMVTAGKSGLWILIHARRLMRSASATNQCQRQAIHLHMKDISVIPGQGTDA